METIVNQILIFLEKTCNIIYLYKIPITILIVLLILIFRILIANALYVKRHDKLDWGIWGCICIAQGIIFLVQRPWIWVVSELLLLIGMYFWLSFADKNRQVKTVIYSNSIVYEDNSEKYAEQNNDVTKITKAKDGKISRSFSFARTHKKLGIPVFVTKFKFKFSATATEEQLAKCVSYLNRYYDEYNWRRQKSKNGIKYEITAEIKTKTNMVLKFDKSISDELDWYVVPIGAIDVSNKAAAHKTPYVWLMHDPKTEGKTYACLKETKLNPPAPQCFTIGQTGGGKSVLINSIIAHFVNKAKASEQTALYLVDPKKVEFGPYESLKEVKGIAKTLDEALELTNKFCEQMHERNSMMDKEGIKAIPLDGKVSLKRHIDINGHLIYGTEIIEYKTKDGKIHKDKALNLMSKKDDIIEVNIPSDSDEEKEEKENSFSW